MAPAMLGPRGRWGRRGWDEDDWRHSHRSGPYEDERGRSTNRSATPPPKGRGKGYNKGKGKEKKIGGWQNKAVALVALIRAEKSSELKRLAEKFMTIEEFAKNVLRHESIVKTHGVDRRMNFDL